MYQAYLRIHENSPVDVHYSSSTTLNKHTQMVVESLSQGSKVSVPNSKDVFIREDRDQLEYRLCSNQKDPCNYTADQWKRQIPEERKTVWKQEATAFNIWWVE